ncbi:OPT oligopeptide transporter [Cantharellus anzutake]|uniref:OPT oligopeptide transporter n=1 Tax=Cantharellus anzutake TaxID=1750568 RepID=UPI00190504F5|nr:OPT oligopeptide transporter [Cantharellus anzutake]KAF8339863.1 OPT oligopeptide transporter [Cantharellus anzutake]
MTPQEHVILQTTAVATGTMPLAAGFVGIIPALSLLTRSQDGVDPINLGWMASVFWSFAVAFFGVFLAAPLRKQVIIKEKLVFPSGTATARLISVLHGIPHVKISEPAYAQSASVRRRGYEPIAAEAYEDSEVDQTVAGSSTELSPSSREAIVKSGWKALGWSFLSSGSLTLFAYFFPFVLSIPIFGTHLATKWLWVFSPSLSYVGQGIIMGFPTTLSMNLGMLVGWGILSPLAKLNGWAPGPVSSMTDGSRGWILWVALAIMTADSLVSLFPMMRGAFTLLFKYPSGWYSLLRPKSGAISEPTSHPFANDVPDDQDDVETSDRLVPSVVVVWGVVGSIALGTIIVWIVFGYKGIQPWATLISFLLGGLFSLLGVRALGETDLNPVSGLGKMSQLVFAVLQPGNVIANIIAGGVAEAGAQQAGDLMQDIKAGHLLGASPRAQFYGQIFGSTLSIFVTATAYSLYTRAYPIPGPNFPTPTAFVWLNLARLLRDGSLPPKSGTFMLFGAAFAVCVSLLKLRAHSGPSDSKLTRYRKWIPSGIAFAIGFLNTPSFSLARLIGGIIEYTYHQHLSRMGRSQSDSIKIIIVASGLVLGEGVVSVVGLILRMVGVGAVSCWGCLPSVCSCP